MAAISLAGRLELVRALGDRYQAGTPEGKGRILDEFVALTGYHRKHAIRLLNDATVASARATPRADRPRLYDEAVRQALVVLWEASDRICAKRLKPLLAILLPSLERHGHIHLDPGVRTRLLAVSASTIDRMLAGTRASAGGRRARPKSTPGIRRSIAVRTFADWHEPAPGFVEADLVAHGGDTAAGSFVHTLVLTDIATGWTECVALLVRESSVIVDALERMRLCLPFPLSGLDTDNGSEFINDTLLAFCQRYDVEFTRSRPYRKNDQAWVEQKNGSVVRRLVGYGRLEGVAAAEVLARPYSASRLFVNFFQPSFKLAEKTRVGARVHKRYHAPETPCARLLSSAAIAEPMKDRLRALLATLDPLRLLDEIRTVQHHLAGLASGQPVHVIPHRDADLDRFLKSLAHAWREGEVRPTHRTGPKPPRHWRTRTDPFEAIWPRIVLWLEAEPDRTAKDLFDRLRDERPGEIPDGQLRTLQRRVKDWRRLAARRLVFAAPLLPAAPEMTHGDTTVKGELAPLGAVGAP
ncbi:MAG: DDE-type integrase/transposase/recombinase [Vicinamibacterales bacterium]